MDRHELKAGMVVYRVLAPVNPTAAKGYARGRVVRTDRRVGDKVDVVVRWDDGSQEVCAATYLRKTDRGIPKRKNPQPFVYPC